MCVAVLQRVQAFWWEKAKFGDWYFSLGRIAALFFTLVALPLAAGTSRLQRLSQPWPPIAALYQAALLLVFFATLLYAVLALSPFVHWRL